VAGLVVGCKHPGVPAGAKAIGYHFGLCRTGVRVMTRATSPDLPLPPRARTRTGAMRRVGVEIELQGLDIDALSVLVGEHVDGRVERISDYEHTVHGDAAGDWRVELDFAYLKARGRDSAVPSGVLGQLDEAAEDLIAAGSRLLVPLEIVTPPLPMDRLDELDRLVDHLREAGARGTRDGVAFAFGLHLNPELPDTDVETLTRYLKGFLCLYDWLKAESRVDLLRRLTVYIDPFPEGYVRKVIAPDYWPGMATLIDDYLADNPTRNRALDMLPPFAEVDEARVRAVVDDDRIKPRPALHYRLPNCEIDEPGWGVREAWRHWLQVEHLAADRDRLQAACTAYREHLEQTLGRLFDGWASGVKPWLVDLDDR
jgi:hypothetical protein